MSVLDGSAQACMQHRTSVDHILKLATRNFINWHSLVNVSCTTSDKYQTTTNIKVNLRGHQMSVHRAICRNVTLETCSAMGFCINTLSL